VLAPDGVATRSTWPSATVGRRAWKAAPATAIVVGVVSLLVSAQGGYFPTSWGWASGTLALLLGVWAISDGRSEIGRLEVAFIGVLAALVGWVGLSILWSEVPAASILELERALVPLFCVTAFLVLARRADLGWLALALVLAITAAALYGLTTRLFPDRLGAFDPFAGYRLSDPIGYWNGLGIFSAIGLLAALAVATGPAPRHARAAAAASTVVLGTTLYFTYSRASWLALALGLGATVALSSRRVATVATAAVLAVPAGLAVLAASRSSALTHSDSVLPDAVDQGRRLATLVAVLVICAIVLVLVLDAVRRRLPALPRVRRAVGLAGWAATAFALVILIAAFGSPAGWAQRGWRAFEAPSAGTGTNLNDRLLSFSGSGRVDLWRTAWHVAEAHPAFGAGAGSFERAWQARPDQAFKARDAHSLYIETLAELGTIGLALLVAALAIPLFAALAARRTPFVPGLCGAYAAFLVHAGVDWDWELAGVTSTALLAGCLLLLAARTRSERLVGASWRAGVVIVALVASIVGTVGLVGNGALAKGRSALERDRPATAISQADRAHRLMPWSPEPWLVRGEAELLGGDRASAATSFRRAIAADAGDWRGWHDLAVATTGRARERALRRALALYPHSAEIRRTIEVFRSASTP